MLKNTPFGGIFDPKLAAWVKDKALPVINEHAKATGVDVTVTAKGGAAARIAGPQATPKGLRHSFGVNAFQSGVPPHLVQRWLGHASLDTTAIYGDVIGAEERAFGARMRRK